MSELTNVSTILNTYNIKNLIGNVLSIEELFYAVDKLSFDSDVKFYTELWLNDNLTTKKFDEQTNTYSKTNLRKAIENKMIYFYAKKYKETGLNVVDENGNMFNRITLYFDVLYDDGYEIYLKDYNYNNDKNFEGLETIIQIKDIAFEL